MSTKHAHSHHHNLNSEKNIWTAFMLNLSFVVIEIIGGVLTNSMAILSDALHDLGDSITLGLSWGLEKYSKKEKTVKYTYGFKRLSLVGAIINSIILTAGSIFIITEAVPRILKPETVSAKGMFVLAIFGIAVNGAAFFKLKKGKKISEKIVSLHMLEDLLGWIAVLIVGTILIFFNLPILDPILSLGISIFVLKNVYINFKEILNIFLQAIPGTYDVGGLKEKITSISEYIEDIHDIHLWTLDGTTNVMTFHLVIKENTNIEDIVELKKKIKLMLSNHDIQEVTIDIENLDNCSNVSKKT